MDSRSSPAELQQNLITNEEGGEHTDYPDDPYFIEHDGGRRSNNSTSRCINTRTHTLRVYIAGVFLFLYLHLLLKKGPLGSVQRSTAVPSNDGHDEDDSYWVTGKYCMLAIGFYFGV